MGYLMHFSDSKLFVVLTAEFCFTIIALYRNSHTSHFCECGKIASINYTTQPYSMGAYNPVYI